jgi:oligoendopeptidase F
MWLTRNRGQYGDAVELPAGYRLGWSYIPHFINTRFYTYAYVFAKLVALVLYARYRDDSDAFVPGYLELLSAGGSADPATLLRRCGVDIADPAVWGVAFAELDRMVEAAESEI